MSASSTNSPSPLHRAHGRAALRKLVTATAVSSFGDGLVTVALPLLALHLTSNALLIGGLAAATRLPWLVVGLPAGALVDRVNRRQLVFVVDVGRAIVVGLVAAVVVAQRSSLPELYVAALLLGVGETLVYAASRSVIPRSAASDEMVKASGRMSVAQTVALEFAGPATGGALFDALRSLPFLGDAISYVCSAFFLRGAIADADRTRISKLLGHEESHRSSIRADLRTGLQWFRRSAPLRALAATVSSFAFCQAAVMAVLVIYATNVLHLSSSGYGLFLALAAVGDVLGSLVAARVHAALRPYSTVVAAGVAAAAGYLVLSSTHSWPVAVIGLALEAAASSIGNVATVSARYRIIPAERFGVVSNTFRMFVVGATPLGALLGGALAASLGTSHTFLVAGSVQLGALVLLAVPLRSLAATEVAPETAI